MPFVAIRSRPWIEAAYAVRGDRLPMLSPGAVGAPRRHGWSHCSSVVTIGRHFLVKILEHFEIIGKRWRSMQI